jgi:hypothetical protein
MVPSPLRYGAPILETAHTELTGQTDIAREEHGLIELSGTQAALQGVSCGRAEQQERSSPGVLKPVTFFF